MVPVVLKATAVRCPPPSFFWTFRDPIIIKNKGDLVRRLSHVFGDKIEIKLYFFRIFESNWRVLTNLLLSWNRGDDICILHKESFNLVYKHV